MRLYKSKDKNRIEGKIWMYKRRRDELRKEYGIVNGKKAPEEYKEKVKNINSKIRNWQHIIMDIEKRRNQLIAISNLLCTFMGVNVRDSMRREGREYRIARSLYIKYCLENRISATLVAEFIGASRGDVVARNRISFNNSFRKHRENRELYTRWTNYIQEFLNKNQEQ